jgi:hypothetical protein
MDQSQRQASTLEQISVTQEDGQKIVIDDILNQHYEILLKLESDAHKLQYLTEDVAQKLDYARNRT